MKKADDTGGTGVGGGAEGWMDVNSMQLAAIAN